jgi:L-iditol 2-dehydrogenase
MEASSLAAVLTAPGEYETREYPVGELAEPGEAIVKVRLCGICGTDKHTYQGYTGQYTGLSNPSDTPFPIIQGHEILGEIVETAGPIRDYGGTLLQPGDRVVVGPNLVCGYCRACVRGGPYTLCENIRDYGNTMTCDDPPHLLGGWSQYMHTLPGTYFFKVPDEVPDEIAVLAEVFAVTVGLDRARQISAVPGESFLFGDSVIVIGCGPLGLLHIVKARMLGAGDIIGVDLLQGRLDAAMTLGATKTVCDLDMSDEDLVGRLLEMTDGGADVVVETAGVPEVIPPVLDVTRPGGVAVIVGNFSDLGPVEITPNRHLVSKGIRLIGVSGQEAPGYLPGMRLMAKDASTSGLRDFVTHRFGIDEVSAAVAKSMEGDAVKVVIDPWKVG